MPMLSWPPVTTSLTLSAFGRTRVSGPGQKRGQAFRDGRHLAHPALQVARIVEMHDHRMIGSAAP